MKKHFGDYIFLIGIAGVIVALDQWTKSWVRTQIPFGGSWSPWPWLEPYARFVHWQNTGAAFGLFQNMNLVFTILAFVVSIAILFYFPRVPYSEWGMRLAMTMQLGGAVGNLIDRLTQGTVTDFISVGTFAVFNVADASISVGTAILILAVWLSERRQKKMAESSQESAMTTPDQAELDESIDWLPEAEDKNNDSYEPASRSEGEPHEDSQVKKQSNQENQQGG